MANPRKAPRPGKAKPLKNSLHPKGLPPIKSRMANSIQKGMLVTITTDPSSFTYALNDPTQVQSPAVKQVQSSATKGNRWELANGLIASDHNITELRRPKKT